MNKLTIFLITIKRNRKMETMFLTITQKMQLMNKMENGDKEVAKIVMDELYRLESVIRDYEIVYRIAAEKVSSNTFKTPKF